ncbi:RNA transcription, translation and transport factor protein-like isoform X1 [Hylaeus volcanicus]|uniref:RNA transcription, translation and transport factor protein-like isoform X1 n=1 Tax=Hylaeus volcanicus TaxID=313075 RepID=UPI0023B7E889|nr:RNA transcription, translation and transport factor protein-like isoform X1 [Hylaeus volcanicus]
MESEKLKLSKFCIRSLNVLKFTPTNGFRIINEELTLQQCQNLVVWLEETKIRLLPKEKRAGLRCTNSSDQPKWLTHFSKYLKSLNIHLVENFNWCNTQNRLDILTNLILLALQDEYMDANEAYEIRLCQKPKFENNCNKDASIVSLTAKKETLPENLMVPTTSLEIGDTHTKDFTKEYIKFLQYTTKQCQENTEKIKNSENSLMLASKQALHFTNFPTLLEIATSTLRLLYLNILETTQQEKNTFLCKLQSIISDPMKYQKVVSNKKQT